MPVSIETTIGMLEALGQQFNLFSLLSAGLLGVPSLMANAGLSSRVVEVQSWLALIGLTPILMLMGLAIGSLYLILIAQGMWGEPLNGQALLRQAGAVWLRVVALGLLLLFFSVSLVVPLTFLIGLLAVVSSGIASFLMGLIYVIVIWLGLYLYFTVDAIVINRIGPIRAIWNSVNVIVRNFWSALGLIILIAILSLGLPLVWLRLSQVHPIATIISIIGHAFIGSGLVAASLLFYRDRYQQWQRQREELEVGG